MEALYKAYKDNKQVAIYLVYIREAHPAEEWKTGGRRRFKGNPDISQHKSLQDRILAASKCMEGLKLTLPILVDGMDGAAEKAYRGRPAATAIVDLGGKLAFYSRGPWGAKPDEADKVLKSLLSGTSAGETPEAKPGD